MKDYLNAEELNDFLLIATVLQTVSKIRKGWSSRNNLTKEEHKNLKYAETYLEKFLTQLVSRLSAKEQRKIENRAKEFELKIIDKYTLQRMKGQWEEELKVAHLKREEFEDWCEQIMEIHCKHCKKHHDSCNLYDVFVNNFVPESGWNLENCRYAYRKPKVRKKVG
ncbi:DUF5651 domain-containing protein [Caminicella sporogenes]|uniref:DUF5651 domain-containing protein n=1 Tax=Caminicella sporogenes TaxID=166485 RepID=UPI00254062B5|nr:DUF5651 domain-containing protein [Caminicella sporogenes]WIF95146.1 DUF5651 domain-containing protein [Caminicella sporogenes]